MQTKIMARNALIPSPRIRNKQKLLAGVDARIQQRCLGIGFYSAMYLFGFIVLMCISLLWLP